MQRIRISRGGWGSRWNRRCQQDEFGNRYRSDGQIGATRQVVGTPIGESLPTTELRLLVESRGQGSGHLESEASYDAEVASEFDFLGRRVFASLFWFLQKSKEKSKGLVFEGPGQLLSVEQEVLLPVGQLDSCAGSRSGRSHMELALRLGGHTGDL